MENELLLNENKNSVSLKRNAKGDYAWDIKLYFEDDKEDVLKKLKSINTRLEEEYRKE